MTALRSSRRMRRATGAIATLAIVAAACGGAGAAGNTTSPAGGSGPSDGTTTTTAPVRTGPPVPDVAFTTFAGERATLADFAGRPLVVNFWASWCPSCVAEMSAAFRPVQEELGEAVTFVGMNIQDDRSAALELLESTGVQWISAEDPVGELYAELGGLGMPFTVFVSEDGRIIDVHNGPLTDRQLRDKIDELLLG